MGVLDTHPGTQINNSFRIDPSFAAFQAALDRGGLIQFSADGAIVLSTNLFVTKDAVVDATDRSVIIDGGGQTRHFYVHTNVSLTLRHLLLTNGYNFEQQKQPVNTVGYGRGGSIYSDGAALLEVVDCQFTHNKASGAGALTGVSYRNGFGYGGDIYNNKGHVRIANCSFLASSCDGTSGTAGFQIFSAVGGSIYSTGGDLSVISAIFDQCLASNLPASTVAAGGAIALFSSQTRVSNSRFLNNSCGTIPIPYGGSSYRIWPGAGGAIYNSGGALILDNCQFLTNFVGNTLVQGAAIYNANASSLACTNSFFSHHNVLGPTNLDNNYPRLFYAPDDQLGGAIFNGGSASFQGSTFEDNAAQAFVDTSGYGGAIYSSNALTVLDCTFYHNRALGALYWTTFGSKPLAGGGGAIFVAKGSALIQFSTFYENNAAGGLLPPKGMSPAFGAALAATNAVVKIRNNIFANLQPADSTTLSGIISDQGFNLCSDASSQLTSATSIRNTDPKLGSYGFYGGAAPVLPLLPGSPATDAGPTNDLPALDQRGAPRLVGAATDIGSYEALENDKLILAGTPPSYNLFYQFDSNRNWTIQTSTDLVVWETYNAANTNQPGFIGATIDNQGEKRFFRANGN